MASTSNKNFSGNYASEMKRYADHFEHQQYLHNSSGQAYTNNLPGLGLLPGQVYSGNLSNNHIDIESYLRGTRASDLVEPKPPVEPSLKSLDSLNIHEKMPVILPRDLVLQPNQRPTWS
jgi:hypothetical protein